MMSIVATSATHHGLSLLSLFIFRYTINTSGEVWSIKEAAQSALLSLYAAVSSAAQSTIDLCVDNFQEIL